MIFEHFLKISGQLQTCKVSLLQYKLLVNVVLYNTIQEMNKTKFIDICPFQRDMLRRHKEVWKMKLVQAIREEKLSYKRKGRHTDIGARIVEIKF